MLWFLVAAVALAIGPLTTAVVYGGAAAVAGAQVARVLAAPQAPTRTRSWRRRWRAP